MTQPALEMALWRLGNVPSDVAQFSADASAWLQQFRLDERERKLMRSLDLRRLSDVGVNELLLLAAFRAVRGPKEMGNYMQQMNTPAT